MLQGGSNDRKDPLLKGYERRGLVPEIHDGVIGNQGVHEADHVMLAQFLLLGGNFIGDYVQPLVHLRGKRVKNRNSVDQIQTYSAENAHSGEEATHSHVQHHNAVQCQSAHFHSQLLPNGKATTA